MPAVELTLEQILDAVRQLPAPERKALLEAMAKLPTPEECRAAARQARKAHRMSRSQQQRLSELLQKGNVGTLTGSESRELEGLVAKFEEGTLRMARDLAREASTPRRAKASD